MTDITELAQQELAQLRAELSNQAIGSKDHLRKIALSLVDKLEKYRDREIRWLALSDEKSKIITDQEEALEKAQETIAFQQGEIKALLSSLESRTVKLPTTRLWAGVTECYEKSDVIAAIRSAGMEVSDD